ncbi:MAG: sigma-70 family RNA polymerase sigma factor [Nitrospira sp.]|nr:sigma-70 family RNA polymerase sigma factor [Nitrospira sp.]HNP29996.1 sigma-70 family RNA polymerase sigma factor [Nitrospirales bacterium]
MPEPVNTTSFPLFHEYYEELLAFLTRKLGSRDQALDVTQETYLRVLNKKTLPPILKPRAFLYKTAMNLSIDIFRKQQRQTHLSLEAEDVQHLLTVPSDQEGTLEAKEHVRILCQAISELPVKCRHVFLLHKFQGRTHAEIATQFGISKNMVEKHVMKAVAYCRQRLEEST